MEATAQTALAGLWERFREAFSAQVAVLEEAAMAVLSGDLPPELADRALREAHKLAGSLGTFGMPRGSEMAREIESWFGPGTPRDQAAILRLSDLVLALRLCVDAGPAVEASGGLGAHDENCQSAGTITAPPALGRNQPTHRRRQSADLGRGSGTAPRQRRAMWVESVTARTRAS
ncbi:MAG: Hpt domain-containing protein [Acidimicrobiales bacterium]